MRRLWAALCAATLCAAAGAAGYDCTDAERAFQFENFELVGLHICDPDTVWRLAQLALPDAEVVLDVGGNLGYTAAMVFGLWSPGHGFNRLALRAAIQSAVRRNTTTNHAQTTTFCKDGRKPDVPLLCRGHALEEPACLTRKPMRVISFDGQAEHVSNQRRVVYEAFPQLQPQASYAQNVSSAPASWEYVHAAVTDSATAARARGRGYFLVNRDELGALVLELPVGAAADTALPVDLVSVDGFCATRGLRRVDVLKVDAEGSDQTVLRGAEETLRERGVQMVTFECTNCMHGAGWRETFEFLDVLGFDCYLHGVNSLVLRATRCWPRPPRAQRPPRPDCNGAHRCPVYMRPGGRNWAETALDSNAYCAHRERASALALLLDRMSLHHYAPRGGSTDAEGASRARGHFHKDAQLSVNAREVRLDPQSGRWAQTARGEFRYRELYGRDPTSGAKVFWENFNRTEPEAQTVSG